MLFFVLVHLFSTFITLIIQIVALQKLHQIISQLYLTGFRNLLGIAYHKMGQYKTPPTQIFFQEIIAVLI